MNTVVRRIDDLGRIVIPKEIRKNLNLKTNDDIELAISNDSLIIKKYSKLLELKDIINLITNILNEIQNSRYAIYSKNDLIVSNYSFNCDLVNKSISTLEIVLNNNTIYSPIICDSNLLGVLVLEIDYINSESLKIISNILIKFINQILYFE